jgi:hypothetical protein
MWANDLFEEQVSSMHDIISFFACDKMGHFRVSIHYYKDRINTTLGSWKSQDEVH